MTYKVFTRDNQGNVKVFATVSNRTDAETAVKTAEGYYVYVDAWYLRTD